MGWFGRRDNDKTAQRASPGQSQDLRAADDRLDAQKVRVLIDTIAGLISTTDHDAVLKSIVDDSIRVVGAERGILFLFDSVEPPNLQIRVARDAAGNDLKEPIQYSTTVTSRVATDGEPMCWKVSSQDQAVDLSQSIVDMKLRAVMCVTLRIKDKRLGVIYVDSRANQRDFSPADLQFFDALAGALSIAVENARLIRETVASERVKEQVKIARTIQEGLLPKNPEEIPGFEMAGWSSPAEEALGDYYDFVPLDDGRWLLAIGDVAGHGIGPALLMSSARSLLRSLTYGEFELANILERMNKRFEADTGGEIFMSLFIAVLDPATKSLTYGNAGHNAPLLVRGGSSGETVELGRTGLALGIAEDLPYEVAGPVPMEPGDILVLTTDGILEARCGDEFFGKERLQESVRRHGALAATDLIEALHRDVLAFTGDAPPDDDLTVVILHAV